MPHTVCAEAAQRGEGVLCKAGRGCALRSGAGLCSAQPVPRSNCGVQAGCPAVHKAWSAVPCLTNLASSLCQPCRSILPAAPPPCISVILAFGCSCQTSTWMRWTYNPATGTLMHRERWACSRASRWAASRLRLGHGSISLPFFQLPSGQQLRAKHTVQRLAARRSGRQAGTRAAHHVALKPSHCHVLAALPKHARHPAPLPWQWEVPARAWRCRSQQSRGIFLGRAALVFTCRPARSHLCVPGRSALDAVLGSGCFQSKAGDQRTPGCSTRALRGALCLPPPLLSAEHAQEHQALAHPSMRRPAHPSMPLPVQCSSVPSHWGRTLCACCPTSRPSPTEGMEPTNGLNWAL